MKKCKIYSGIGGQAVIEGVMMKNKDKYAVAVRKDNGDIAVEVDHFSGVMNGNKFRSLPFVRGVFNFVESLMLGMRSINMSAEVSIEEEIDSDKAQKDSKIMTGVITAISVIFAVALFIVLPYYLSTLFEGIVVSKSLIAILEGVIRIAIFLLYVTAISAMDDIKRLYRYHGAEHKCINCIEKGRPLTVRNVMRSSRIHKRCGTSFMFFVLFVSIILFFFIRVENPVYRVGLRILLMPLVAGISYEIIRWAGTSNNIFVRLISAPGMWIQRMTTKEPDKEMVEVAIAAVEAVFDWKQFLKENFDYEDPEEVPKQEQPVEEQPAGEEQLEAQDELPEGFEAL